MDKEYIRNQPAIDWKKCYEHLQGIEGDFRNSLFNAVFEKFFPKHASLASIDDCISLNDFKYDFFFFDKRGQIYYYNTSFMDEHTKYVFFDWKRVTARDRENMIYSKSSRRRFIARDKERQNPLLLSKSQAESALSGRVNFGTMDEPRYEPCDTPDSAMSAISAFGESEMNESGPVLLAEPVIQGNIHADCLYVALYNFPPRFTFRMDADLGGSAERQKELNLILDALAGQFNLKHYRATYKYNYKAYPLNKLVDSVTFKKSPCNHMFKPDYSDFIL